MPMSGSTQPVVGRLRMVVVRAVDHDADNMSEPFIVQAGQGRLLDLGTFEAVVLADAAGTSGAFTVLQTQGEPSGFGPPLHVHRDAAEAFYVLDGTYLMHLEERQELCAPGSFVYVPPNVVHTFVVVSQGPGRKLNLFSPSAMVGFFEELAEAEADGTATPERLAEISERNHMGIAGPVPDTYL
jgi:quercetin dioxygenase-like cupin family protein